MQGKDFNKAAYEHLKIAKYHFQYLRMQEQMYNLDQKRVDKETQIENILPVIIEPIEIKQSAE